METCTSLCARWWGDKGNDGQVGDESHGHDDKTYCDDFGAFRVTCSWRMEGRAKRHCLPTDDVDFVPRYSPRARKKEPESAKSSSSFRNKSYRSETNEQPSPVASKSTTTSWSYKRQTQSHNIEDPPLASPQQRPRMVVTCRPLLSISVDSLSSPRYSL